MELFGKFILGFAFLILLTFYSAWGYSTSWNMVIPAVFGFSKITMLQAWVATLVFSVLTSHSMNTADPDMKVSPFIQSLIFGFVKVTLTLIFALIIKAFFI